MNPMPPTSRAELLIQSITDYAIFMLDPGGIIISWNAGAQRLKGYKPDEIIGEHFSRFYSEEDRTALTPQIALETALREGRFEAEGWRVRQDGSRFWANVVIDPVWDEQGEHAGFAKVTRDLSERKEAEEAIRRSEERFRLLVQGVTDYAIYMLDPEGNVSSWNAGAERFKGFRSDEIVGQHFSVFYPEEERGKGAPQKALETSAAEGRFEAEGWRVRKDGGHFWAHVVIDPIRNEAGTLLGFTKITRDLTERKRAQEELETTREQLFQSQKMEAIGNLTGGVAHDFNNILAVILSSIRIARKRLSSGQDVDQFLQNATEAAERGASLTQRMLAFARKQELRLKPVDLIVSVREVAGILERAIGPSIAIVLDLPAALRPAIADRAQLDLAVMNLIVNARDAMPQGGTITIRAREDHLPSQTPFICLSVEDDGDGMDAETLVRAIDPFFTTKGVGKGTGLGLSMVQGMVQQCGGELKLESEQGRGTKVEICLRVADESAPRGQEIARTDAGIRPLRILAVDDDAIILLNTGMILSDMGHEVFEASSGKSALELLDRQKVDLMITDFAMPGMTGAELIEQARDVDPELKVILASGYVDLPAGKTLDLPRLAKPFTENELADAISSVACHSGPAPARTG